MERIKSVSITKDNKLLLSLESKGNTDYQYIYREAAGVYWNEKHNGFESTPLKNDMSCSEWFAHIIKTANSSGIELSLSKDVSWLNIESVEKEKILNEHSI